MSSEPEFESVEAFVEFCLDDDRETFSAEDLQALSAATQTSIKKLRVVLESWGLTLAPRASERRVRGFTANPHDRWIVAPCFGGSGWEQISGFSGQEG